MQKLRYNITSKSGNQGVISLYEEIMSAAMSRTKCLVCDHDYLVPNGWRTIIHIKTHDDVHVHLDLQSNAGGGNYAKAKMNTLTADAERFASGGEDISELVEMLGNLDGSGELSDLITKVGKYDSVAQIPDELADYMNEQFGIAPYYGAIRIPYEVLSAKVGSSDKPQKGEIRISFSGASQEQDVMFAMWIFRELQEKLTATMTTEQIWFNLRKLREIPCVNLWVDLLGLRGPLCP